MDNAASTSDGGRTWTLVQRADRIPLGRRLRPGVEPHARGGRTVRRRLFDRRRADVDAIPGPRLPRDELRAEVERRLGGRREGPVSRLGMSERFAVLGSSVRGSRFAEALQFLQTRTLAIRSYLSTASSSSAMATCSSAVCATWIEPGPNSNGTPQFERNGTSVVNGKTADSIPRSSNRWNLTSGHPQDLFDPHHARRGTAGCSTLRRPDGSSES